MQTGRKWLVGLMLAIVAIMVMATSAMADGEPADPEAPKITLSIADDLTTYAVAKVYVETENFETESPEDEGFFQYCYSTTAMDINTIPSSKWKGVWEYIWVTPEDITAEETGILYVRVKNGNEWVTTQKTLSFTPLNALTEDESLRIEWTENAANIFVNGYTIVKVTGPANQEGYMTGPYTQETCINELGFVYTEVSTGEKTGTYPVAMLTVQEGQQVRSNILTLQTSSLGTVQAPQYNVTSAAQIPLNGTFDITITARENAAGYFVELKGSDSDEYYGDMYLPVSQAGSVLSFQVPITGGQAGDLVTATVKTEPKSGYTAEEIPDNAALHFSLAEASATNREILFKGFESEHWVNGENYVQIICRGAESIAVEWPNDVEAYLETENEGVSDYYFYIYEAGSYTVRATATYPDGTSITATKDFSVLPNVMMEVTSQIPDYLMTDVGGTISFTVQNNESAGLGVELRLGNKDINFSGKHGVEIQILPSWLENTDRIHYYVYNHDPQHFYYDVGYIPVVKKAPGTTVQLTTASNQVPANSDVTFQISAPGADDTWLIWNENRVHVSNNGTNIISFDAGIYRLYLKAEYGEDVEYSEVLVLECISEGPYPGTIEYSLEGLGADRTIGRAEKLTVRFTENEDVVYYNAVLYEAGNNRWIYGVSSSMSDSDTVLEIPMIQAADNASVYLWISASVIGYDPVSVKTEPFTVTPLDPALLENGIYFSLPETIQTGDFADYTIYAPGASRVGIGNAHGGWTNSRYGDSLSGSFGNESRPATRQYIAWAEINGERKEVIRTLETIAPNGTVSVDLSMLPTWLKAGTDAEITIGLPDKIKSAWIQIDIESEESSEDYYEAYFQDRIYTLSIPAEKLTDGKTLIIQMYGYSMVKGYAAESVSVNIPVLTGISDRVTLSAPDEVLLYSEYMLTGTAPGADQIQIISPGGEAWTSPSANGDFTYTGTAWNSGMKLCYAVAYYGEEKEYSLPVWVNVISHGSYQETFDWQVTGLTAEDTVARGSSLTLTMGPLQTAGRIDYAIYHMTEDGDQWIDDHNQYFVAGEEVIIPISTLRLQEGEKYFIELYRRVIGYEEDYAYFKSENGFTITAIDENRMENGIFADVPAEALTNEPIQISAYAPGANHVEIRSDKGWFNGNFNDEDSISVEERINEPTILEIEIRAEIEGQVHSIRRTIEVKAPYGMVEVDASSIPTYLTSGGNLQIDLPLPNHGKQIYADVQAYQQTTGWYWMEDGRWVSGSWTGSYSLQGFEAGDCVDVSISLETERGYASKRINIQIPVLGTIDPDVTLTASETQVPVGGTVVLEGSASNTDSLILHYWNHNTTNYDDKNSFRFESTVPREAGQWVCYIEAVNGEVRKYSEPVVIRTISLGQYEEEIEFSLEGVNNGVIAQNEDLTIRFPNTIQGAEYEVSIDRRNEYGGWDDVSWRNLIGNGQEMAVSWSGFDLEPNGEYRIQIRRWIIGYNSDNRTSEIFTATGVDQSKLDENGMLVKLPETALTFENYPIAVYAENATRVGYDCEGETHSSESNLLSTSASVGIEQERIYLFWAEIDGIRYEVEKTIRIEAPYGRASVDFSQIPTCLITGQESEFTIGKPESATYMWINLYRIDSNGSWFNIYSSNAAAVSDWTGTIPMAGIQAGERVRVSVELQPKPGYSNSGPRYIEIPVFDQVSERVQMAASEESVPVNGTVTFEASASGADRLILHYLNNQETFSGETATYVVTVPSTPGTWICYAEAVYGNTSEYSTPLIVQTYSNGKYEPSLAFTLEGLQNRKLAQNQNLVIRIPATVDGARYEVDLRGPYSISGLETLTGNGEEQTVTMDGFNWTVGETYQIVVYRRGIVGYDTEEVISEPFTLIHMECEMLPANLTRIEEEAFEGSAMVGITIPAGCTAIESRAFAGCSRLRLVVFEGMNTEIADDAFDGAYNIRFEGPAGSDAEAYANQHGINFTVR